MMRHPLYHGDTEHGGGGCNGDACKAPNLTVNLDTNATAKESTTLRVTGMDCADEVAAIEQVFKGFAGVRRMDVNLMGRTVTIAHASNLTPNDLIAVIAKAGLKATTIDAGSKHPKEPEGQQRSRFVSFAISGLLTAIGLALQWAKFEPEGMRIGAFVIAIVAGGWLIAPKAVRAIGRRSLDMNVLMTVAVIGAAVIGEWSEGAAVVFLFALSELLEAFSLNRARRAVQSLLKLAPETALVKRGEQFVEVPVEQIAIGEHLSIRSGAKVPLDGNIIAGGSSINQAPITGESMPVEKKVGDPVFAGTINGEGALDVIVTKAHTDTTLAKIIKLVGEAQGQKAPSQRFVDRFARFYTPAVFVTAILVFITGPLLFGGIWSAWAYKALVLLVIACPCALVISTPVSIVSGLTAMARRGVLIKGGTFLEEVGKLKALAVDKTGTITEGKPRVTQIVTFNGKQDQEVLRIAAAIDTHSDHPLAKAVVTFTEEKGIKYPRSEKYQSKIGRGAEGMLEGHEYFVGNHRFAHELGVCTPEVERVLAEIEEHAQSVVVIGHKPHDGHAGEVLGVLAVGDTIRTNASEAVKALHKAGVEKIIMLSGDNQRTVDAISKQVGIDEARGGLLPDDKVEAVKALTRAHKFVGMVGDGVNDAPAMAVATIGIAMGGAGTDTAIETADIALMKDDLSKVAEAVLLGQRTLRIVKFNITFALAIKAVFLVLAFAGHTSLWLAILADTGATLVVIANALRLLRPSAKVQ
ncbi:MAG: heavy metal translocating P-type ATPase [Verrucomicrobiota bacterium]|nr:heavy metal translocating P-type ATPase [Verrucomicrobiota bacterium]